MSSVSLLDQLKGRVKPFVLSARAITTFQNFWTYFDALRTRGSDKKTLVTRDGLKLVIRQNQIDAGIVREIFLERVYLRYFKKRNPIIVDIGGYIGDFSIYTARYLNARVIAYEPTTENHQIFKENIALNQLQGQIELVNKAVSSAHEVTLNVDKNENEIHVSAYWYSDGTKRVIPSVTLEEIFEIHQLEKVDLLKIDCEGGEYDILLSAPISLFSHIENLIFEYHKIDGYQEKLSNILRKLQGHYEIREHGPIIHALHK